MQKKVECLFCHKKFHSKGIASHKARCKERPQPPATDNFVGLSPFAKLVKAANEFWETLSDQQKLRACAFVSYTSDRGLL